MHITGAYSNHAGTRPCKLDVPATCSRTDLPLLVMLHGCTQTAGDFAAGTRVSALAEEVGLFALYPEQMQAASHSRRWNGFRDTSELPTRGEAAILAGMTHEMIRLSFQSAGSG
jgi:poly(3-hydroxybutyrate) depolymerase